MLRYILILIACTPLLIFLLPALLLWLITLPIVIPLRIFSLHARIMLADINQWILQILDPFLEVYRDNFARLRTEIRYHLIDKPMEKQAERVRQAEREAERQAEEEYRKQHTLICTADQLAAHIPQPEGKTFIEVAEGIERIPDSAFAGWDQMREITLPSTLKEIGSSAFENCTALWMISLPEGVTKVGDSAFRNCTALTRIFLPETVTELSKDAFAHCPELRRISLPDSLYSRLREIAPVDRPIELFCSGRESRAIILSPLKKIRPAAVRDTSVTDLILCPGTEAIGERAFLHCSKIEQAELPDTLRFIGRKAFRNCGDLYRIRIPASVTEIAGDAFPECTRIIAEPGSYAYRWAEKRDKLARGR